MDMRSDSQNLLSAKSEEAVEQPKWTRHAAQSCQIPNDLYLETEACDNGCFYVAFSHDGKYLACALSDEYDYPILVYKVCIFIEFFVRQNFGVFFLSFVICLLSIFNANLKFYVSRGQCINFCSRFLKVRYFYNRHLLVIINFFNC